ncbi:aminopeptidase [Natrialbaceae archaeon A-gly3]
MEGGDTQNGDDPYIDGVDRSEVYDEKQLQPTPEQHERLKDGLHGELFDDIRRADRRYLVMGRGSGKPGDRRKDVCALLDERIGAIAFRLEDFGFTGEELELWAPAFDILSEMASHIVGILEDYDGGHVWELGYLYHYQTTVRNVFWLLKRVYDDEETMRERYDNGMAASHLAALEEAVSERVIEWESPEDLPRAVESIP